MVAAAVVLLIPAAQVTLAGKRRLGPALVAVMVTVKFFLPQEIQYIGPRCTLLYCTRLPLPGGDLPRLVTLLSFSGGSTSFDLSVRQNNINIDAAAHANIKKVGLGRAAQQGAGTEQSPSAGYFPLVMVPSRPAESN